MIVRDETQEGQPQNLSWLMIAKDRDFVLMFSAYFVLGVMKFRRKKISHRVTPKLRLWINSIIVVGKFQGTQGVFTWSRESSSIGIPQNLRWLLPMTFIYIFRFPFHWVKRFINESEKKQSENKDRIYVLYLLIFFIF